MTDKKEDGSCCEGKTTAEKEQKTASDCEEKKVEKKASEGCCG